MLLNHRKAPEAACRHDDDVLQLISITFKFHVFDLLLRFFGSVTVVSMETTNVWSSSKLLSMEGNYPIITRLI